MDTHGSSTIVILDFGSQYTQLIARRIRELDVFSVVLPCTAPLERVLELKPKGIILSGGPASVGDAGSPRAPEQIFTAGIPILAVTACIALCLTPLGVPASASAHITW